MAFPCVGGDQVIDQFLDDGKGGVSGGQFGDVFGGFERDHVSSIKKPATWRA